MNRSSVLWLITVLTVCGCGVMEVGGPSAGSADPGGKADTAWVAANTIEIDGIMTGVVTHQAAGEWTDLASDRALMEELVDDQVKFGKNAMKKHDYHLNQLAQNVTILEVTQKDQVVTIRYEAAVDMTAPDSIGSTLEELGQTEFDFSVPLDPIQVYAQAHESCAKDWEPYSVSNYNYYYYFAPDKEGCEIPMHQAHLTLTRVQKQQVAYPEYDRLLHELDDGKIRGFTAAVFAGVAEDEVKGRLERTLGLQGTNVDGEVYTRYRMEGDGVAIIIDFYPESWDITPNIRKALGSYHLIYYHGHSSYGTQPYFTDKDSFASHYQIFGVSSCRSYSYYARQILKQKATQADPNGWDAADVMVNVLPGWVGWSSVTMVPLFRGLLQGIEAVHNGDDLRAPSWQTIIDNVEARDDRLHGLAGARTNMWRPGS